MERGPEDENHDITVMFAMDTWNKMMVIAGAAAAVAITIFLVVCCIGDGCLLHDLITRNKRESRSLFLIIDCVSLVTTYCESRQSPIIMLPLESLHSYSLIPNGAVTAGRNLTPKPSKLDISP